MVKRRSKTARPARGRAAGTGNCDKSYQKPGLTDSAPGFWGRCTRSGEFGEGVAAEVFRRALCAMHLVLDAHATELRQVLDLVPVHRLRRLLVRAQLLQQRGNE